MTTKGLYLIGILFLVLFSINVTAQNKLILQNADVEPNQNFSLKLNLTNSENVVGYQFDILVPTGITYRDSFEISNRHTDHEVSSSQINDSTFRFICFSMQNSEIEGSSGNIIELYFTAPDRQGEYELIIVNPILSSLYGTNVIDSTKNGSISVVKPTGFKNGSNNSSNNKNQLKVYPNPFNGFTNLIYYKKNNRSTLIRIFNSIGEIVDKIHKTSSNKGWNKISLDFTNQSSGVYIVQILSDTELMNKKVLLVE